MTAGHGREVTAAANGGVRTSDADRERAVDLLSAAFAEGRLTKEEHEARVQDAYGARTHAELAALSADLPAGPPGTLPPQEPALWRPPLPRPGSGPARWRSRP